MEGARSLAIVLPVLLAGIVQVLVIRFDPWPRTAVPLDLGASWRGRRVFGPNKTWRGLVVMTVSCGAASAAVFRWLPPDTEPTFGWGAFGLLLGLAYCLAELPNSFVKRRLGIEAGGRAGRHSGWQDLADQADSMVGMLVVIALTLSIPWPWLAVLLVVGVLLHVVVDKLLHTTGVKAPDARVDA